MANWSTLTRTNGIYDDSASANTTLDANPDIESTDGVTIVTDGFTTGTTTTQQVDIDGANINITGNVGLDGGIRLDSTTASRVNITNCNILVQANSVNSVWGAGHGNGTSGNRGHNLSGCTVGVADGITGSNFTVNQNRTDASTWNLNDVTGLRANFNLAREFAVPGIDFGVTNGRSAASVGTSTYQYALVGAAGTGYQWTAIWDADFSQAATTDLVDMRSGGFDAWFISGESGRWQPTALRVATNNAAASTARALYHWYPTFEDADGNQPSDMKVRFNLQSGRNPYVKPRTFDNTSEPASHSDNTLYVVDNNTNNIGYLIEVTTTNISSSGTVYTLSEPTPGTDSADFSSLTHIVASGVTLTRTALNRNADGTVNGSHELGSTLDSVWEATVTNGGYDTATAASTLDELYCQAKQVLYDANANTDEVSFDTTTGEINFGSHDVTLISNLAMAYDETTGFSLATAATLSDGDTISVIEGTGDLHFGDRSPSGLTISMNVEGLPNTITNNFTIGQTGESHSVDLTAQSDIEWDVDFAGTVTLNAGAGRTVNFGRTGGTGSYTAGTGTINDVATVEFEAPSSGTVNVFSVDGTTFTHRGTMTSTSANLERDVTSGEDSWVVVHGGPGFNTQVYRTGTITISTTIPAPTSSSDALSNTETSGDDVYSGGSVAIQGTPTAGEGNTTIRIDGTDRGSGGTNPIPNGIQTNNLLGTLLDDQDYQLAIAVNNNTLATGSWRTGSDINNLVTFIASNTSEISNLVELDSDGNTVERLTGVSGDFSISGGTATLNSQNITIDLVDIRENTTPDSNVIGNVVADRLTGDIDDAVQAANDARDAAQNTEAEVLLNTF